MMKLPLEGFQRRAIKKNVKSGFDYTDIVKNGIEFFLKHSCDKSFQKLEITTQNQAGIQTDNKPTILISYSM
jgi:hypothetical protein